jgi:hypothetical protein
MNSLRQQQRDHVFELLLRIDDHDFPVGTDDVSVGHTADKPGLVPFRHGPAIDGRRPALSFHVSGHFFEGGGCIRGIGGIYADGEECDPVALPGELGGGLLHRIHRTLAGAAPGRPEFEHDNFAAMLRIQ